MTEERKIAFALVLACYKAGGELRISRDDVLHIVPRGVLKIFDDPETGDMVVRWDTSHVPANDVVTP